MEPIIKIKETNEEYFSAWEGYLTIQYISIWKEKFLNLTIKTGSKLSVDLHKIQRIDTAGVQLLVYIKKHCLQNHIHLTLNNHSLPVIKVFDVLGMIGFFGDKIKISKEFSNELELSYGTKKE
ncbi:MAG: STAS domain-containing protein [Leptospira sp.]|nr:STAS domain-containing protein [Leptospira sp.]